MYNSSSTPNHLPILPDRDVGIGVVGAGFIVRDCHLVAYNRPVSASSASLRAPRRRHGGRRAAWRAEVYATVERSRRSRDLGRRRRRAAARSAGRDPSDSQSPRARIRGDSRPKAAGDDLRGGPPLVEACDAAGVLLQVNQNMRYDHSVRALKTLLDREPSATPVLATIDMRAIPHWMPWAEGGRSLATFIMSIHHLDTFRYWLGDPLRILASTRPDPRTARSSAHADGINLYILEYAERCARLVVGRRLGRPGREGARVRDRHPLAGRRRVRASPSARSAGPVGRRSCPARSTIPRSPTPALAPSPLARSLVPRRLRRHDGRVASWPLETGIEPDISGRDNLKTVALCEAVFTAAREHRVVTR